MSAAEYAERSEATRTPLADVSPWEVATWEPLLGFTKQGASAGCGATASTASPVQLAAPAQLAAAAAGGGAPGHHAHDAPHGVVAQQYPPDDLVGVDYYRPTTHGHEETASRRVEALRRILRSGDGGTRG